MTNLDGYLDRRDPGGHANMHRCIADPYMGPTPIVDSGCLLLNDILTMYNTWDAH